MNDHEEEKLDTGHGVVIAVIFTVSFQNTIILRRTFFSASSPKAKSNNTNSNIYTIMSSQYFIMKNFKHIAKSN